MAFTTRSDRTRDAILRAARRRFAAEGYERTTIRAVAADAGIDPSMVMRYYGSKDGLFAVAAEIDLRLPDLSEVPRKKAGELFVRHFFERWEGELADDVLVVAFRSAATNEAATERLREVFGNQAQVALARVVADPKEVPARAALVTSQLLGIAMCRYVLKLPPMVTMDAETLVASVAPTVQRYLTGPLPGVGARKS